MDILETFIADGTDFIGQCYMLLQVDIHPMIC